MKREPFCHCMVCEYGRWYWRWTAEDPWEPVPFRIAAGPRKENA